MTEHTPTPWGNAAAGQVMAGYSQPFAIFEEGKPNLIAGCFGDVHGGVATAEANAAFIVKTANMHQELVDAVTACGTALSLIRFDADQNPQLAEAGRLVRAVLTKVA